MATPFAAGSLALALQAAPAWTAARRRPRSRPPRRTSGLWEGPGLGAGLIDVPRSRPRPRVRRPRRRSRRTSTSTASCPTGASGPTRSTWSADDLDVPIAASIVLGGECTFSFRVRVPGPPGPRPRRGAPRPERRAALAQPVHGRHRVRLRQETLHAMPTVAGTYEIRARTWDRRTTAWVGRSGWISRGGRSATRRPASTATPSAPGPRGRPRLDLTVTSRVWRARVTIRCTTAGTRSWPAPSCGVASARPGAPSPARRAPAVGAR